MGIVGLLALIVVLLAAIRLLQETPPLIRSPTEYRPVGFRLLPPQVEIKGAADIPDKMSGPGAYFGPGIIITQ